MSIRNASKAIVIHNGKMLITKCCNSKGEIFYTLPGGRQNFYETMEEAVVRECLEETGLTVSVDRFVALHEEIVMNEEYKKANSDFTHKIFHIFLCHLENEEHQTPTEIDENQIDFEWIQPQQILSINFYPKAVKESMLEILNQDKIFFLGSVRTSEEVSL